MSFGLEPPVRHCGANSGDAVRSEMIERNARDIVNMSSINVFETTAIRSAKRA